MLRLILITIMMTVITSSEVVAFDHTPFDAVLREHVVRINEGRATEVDYRNLKNHEARLDAYLDSLTGVARSTFDAWGKAEQLAFLINAYNGWTLKLIVEAYPDLASIKDLGSLFQSPWKKRFIPLLQETRSLDDIEHGLIRGSGRYDEPRIHFAVNCASIGCPALRNEAYRADILDEQLDEATRLFLSDRTRNRFDGKNTLYISSIFKWYKEDFERGWRGFQTLEQFLAGNADSLGLSPDQTEKLKNGVYVIKYLDYDWGLNDLSHE